MSTDRPLFEIPRDIQTRMSSPESWTAAKGAAAQTSRGRKGSPCFCLHAGESKVLAEAKGTAGILHRIWCTISNRSFEMLRGMRIDIYWDGAARPAVSAPFGDFFGHGIGRMSALQNVFFSSPEARSFNCCIPMPFRRGMKVVVTNETAKDQGMLFFDVTWTAGDTLGPDTGYLHAHWRRENPTEFAKDYEFLPRVEGRGRYLGVNVGVIADTGTYYDSWWGEGECKFYVDGDTEHPTLCGTGTEDYIGTGWGMGAYAHQYQGCTIADRKNMEYAFYRYHVPDPVYFSRDIRVSMQQIGCWGPDNIRQLHDSSRPLTSVPDGGPVDLDKAAAEKGYGLFERRDDWSSCCYFYLDKPESSLPPLAGVASRTAGLRQHGEPERREDA